MTLTVTQIRDHLATARNMTPESHNWACICHGRGTIEDGPAGATYSVPCPGPPARIRMHGFTYIRADLARSLQAVGKDPSPPPPVDELDF